LALAVGTTSAALGVVTDVVFESMNVDQTFAGSGHYSYPGVAPTASTWTAIDCKTITLP
jgi:hypothetical protein